MGTVTVDELTNALLALTALLLSAQALGFLFYALKMPKVIGEIAGGLLLGPTFFGALFPQAQMYLFGDTLQQKLVSFISWLGLLFLMFISGFEIQKSIDRSERKTVAILLFGATFIPLVAGWFAPSLFDVSQFLGSANNSLALRLIIALALAVTSIPVIAKIFLDLGIMETAFAKIVIATAVIEDMILWVVLAVALGLVGEGQPTVGDIFIKIIVTLAFFSGVLLFSHRIINCLKQTSLKFLVRFSLFGYVILTCLVFVLLASLLDVHLVFGALLAGITIGRIADDRIDRVKDSIKEFSFALFIPLYFATVGLQLDLLHGFPLGFFFVFLLFAVLSKTIGTFIAARGAQFSWLSSLNLSVAMNTRGGPGIVLATVAHAAGIIDERLFAVFVLVAIVTSLLAGSWFRYIISRGWPLLRIRHL